MSARPSKSNKMTSKTAKRYVAPSTSTSACFGYTHPIYVPTQAGYLDSRFAPQYHRSSATSSFDDSDYMGTEGGFYQGSGLRFHDDPHSLRMAMLEHQYKQQQLENNTLPYSTAAGYAAGPRDPYAGTEWRYSDYGPFPLKYPENVTEALTQSAYAGFGTGAGVLVGNLIGRGAYRGYDGYIRPFFTSKGLAGQGGGGGDSSNAV